MATAREVYQAAFLTGLQPEAMLTVSVWAEAHRILPQKSSAEPGPWRTARTPYLKEIMDCLSPSSPVEQVVFMKGAQIGGTECGNNWIGYVIHGAPGPMLIVQPTVETAKRWSRQRLAPMIEESAVLRELVKEPRERDSGNTVQSKEFPGGLVIITGANSAVGLRSMPVRYLFLDEIDGYPGDVEGEGDPADLAQKRTATFTRRKIFKCSTPLVKGTSRIEAAYEASDRRRYYVPCPHCQFRQPLRWANLRFKDGEGVSRPELAAYECEACHQRIPEHHKPWMLEHGQWIAEAPGPGKAAGFHLSALYSPLGWSWEKIVEEFLAAKGNPVKLKTWVNTCLGETWEESGEAVDEAPLYARREAYGPEVPEAAALLTAGVDIQDDRIEVVLIAWGRREESWSMEYKIFHGPLIDPEGGAWKSLDDYLQTVFTHESGLPLRIACATVDTGGHHTKEAYAFVRKRQVRRVFAVKGSKDAGRPLVSRPTMTNLGKVKLFQVGVDTAKSVIYGRLKLTEPGPGYMHFPMSFDREHFEQLTAEKCIPEYVRGFPIYRWIKIRARNEALDTFCYGMAALAILNPNLDRLVDDLVAKAAQPRKATTPSRESQEPRDPLPKPPAFVNSGRPMRRPGGFVGGWRR